MICSKLEVFELDSFMHLRIIREYAVAHFKTTINGFIGSLQALCVGVIRWGLHTLFSRPVDGKGFRSLNRIYDIFASVVKILFCYILATLSGLGGYEVTITRGLTFTILRFSKISRRLFNTLFFNLFC